MDFFSLVVHSTLNWKVGTPINSMGFRAHIHLVNSNFELGTGVQSRIFFSGLGPKGTFFENRFDINAKLVWGNEIERNPLFAHPSFNNSQKSNSLCYAYYWFWDTRNTSQSSGAWSIEQGRFFFYLENDVFAGRGMDRFRTGSWHLMYREATAIWSVNTQIWTGETRGAVVVTDKNYPSPKGYKDLSKSNFGPYSNGIFSLGYFRGFGLQAVGLELGIDHERVRHFFQNILIHDFPYFPNRSGMKNRHLPMLDQHGHPFLNPQIQTLRSGKLVLQGKWGFD